MAELSPMMQQYFKIKEENKDSILFFRLGDFYEMFFEDAKLASKELELTLTGRDCGQEERAPMCGVPYHSSEGYIARLVAKGYKVAICEQVEEASKAKGLVKRDVIRVITPGTVTENSMLDESKNNYVSCIYTIDNSIGISFCDISTGQFHTTAISSDGIEAKIKDELSRFNPREIIVGGDTIKLKSLAGFIKDKLSASVDLFEDELFELEKCKAEMIEIFSSEDVVKIEQLNSNEIIRSIGALLWYLKDTQKRGLERINTIDIYSQNEYMNLDFNTRRNLELIETMRNKSKKGSLLWVLDRTKTAMGKRLIRLWIEQPLLNYAQIIKRQNSIEELFSNTVDRLEIMNALGSIFDIERLLTRIVHGNSGAKELRNLASAIKNLPELKDMLEFADQTLLKELKADLDPLEDVFEIIDKSIVDLPPFSVREGGMIKDNYDDELDSVRKDMNNSSEILAQIETQERKITGIPKLKVAYNRVFGYYIEVSNSYKELVPETYIRKQTLTNCERYITQELKEVEGRILGAKEKSVALEFTLYEEIRSIVAKNVDRIQKTANAIAILDVLCSLANVAADNRYVRPLVNLSGVINLKESRHPVVECILNDSPFVPNDVLLDLNDNKVSIITGPNMAGKSTYMRQVALIVLMAQMGSFVPAQSAEIGIVDSVFTRVGASDDLNAGQSTFMVEMSEVAYIIKNATSKSLLILDEIGRGTSTFDGMSIARAVLEYVVDNKKLGAKSLFATHYHELTVMEEQLSGVKNYNIAVKKRGDDITFLRRIVRGGADESYGIEVAKLAGVPNSVIKRAKDILKELDNQEQSINKNKVYEESKEISIDVQDDFEEFNLLNNTNDKLKSKLNEIDINTLTPIESMNILFELIKTAKED